jgi:hypothetical protein
MTVNFPFKPNGKFTQNGRESKEGVIEARSREQCEQRNNSLGAKKMMG